MKLFGREISFSKVKERFKGTFDSLGTPYKSRNAFYSGQHSWLERCIKYHKDYERHPLAKQAMIALGGQIIAEDIFLKPAVNSEGKPYPRSEEIAEKCEDLNERIQIKQLLFETGKQMGKYGSHFWEKTWTPQFHVRAIPSQEAIEPAFQDGQGNIIEWRQRQNMVAGKTTRSITWKQDDIVANHWDVTTHSWPYGTSLLVGLDTEFETMEDLEVNANSYMKKQAWPYEVFQIGNGVFQPTEDDFSNVQSKLKSANVGEKLVTDIPSQILQGGTGGAPIRELSNILDFMKDNLQDGLIMPSLSKLYNSTEASAKVVVGWAVSCLVKPMQEILRVNLREQVYKPYLEDLGYSVKKCPEILFESPDAHKLDDMEFWKGAFEMKAATPQQCADGLGIDYDKKYWKKQAEREAEQLKLQQQQGQSQQQQSGGRTWEVKEVKKKDA